MFIYIMYIHIYINIYIYKYIYIYINKCIKCMCCMYHILHRYISQKGGYTQGITVWYNYIYNMAR